MDEISKIAKEQKHITIMSRFALLEDGINKLDRLSSKIDGSLQEGIPDMNPPEMSPDIPLNPVMPMDRQTKLCLEEFLQQFPELIDKTSARLGELINKLQNQLF